MGLDEDSAALEIERSVFFWVPSKKGENGGKPAQYETITANDIASDFGCPRSIVTEYVRREVQEAAACQALPFTLLLVLSYACMVVTHMSAPTVRSVEDSLVHDILENANFAFDSAYMGHKGVDDVNSYADFWSFMSKGLVPLLFTQERVWSEDLHARNVTNTLEREAEQLAAQMAALPSLSNSASSIRSVDAAVPTITTTTTTTTTATMMMMMANSTTRRPSSGPGSGDPDTGWSSPSQGPGVDGASWILPSEYLDAPMWGFQINYNRIVGGIRLRQERATETKECSVSPDLNKFYGRACTVGAPREYDIDPELEEARSTVPDDSKTEWLWVYWPLDTVYQRLLELEATDWLDEQTAKIEVGIPVYNAEFGVHTLMTVNFYFSRGGHIFKHIIAQSCYINWLSNPMNLLFDMTYVMCIGWIFISELMEVGTVFLHSGAKGVMYEYMGFWNIIDWTSVLTGMMLLGSFGNLFLLTASLNEAAEVVGALERYGEMSLELAIPEVDSYAELLGDAVAFVTLIQRMLAVYPLIIVFRLFKSFHAQPRLALVTNTMQESMTDLAHFLFVFMCVFMGFVASAVVLFGREVDELSTFRRGFIYCFRLLLGDFDFDELKTVGRLAAGLWLMTFMVLLNVILMNMLLAIVMDSYGTVKANLGNAETLMEEMRQQVQRGIERRKGTKQVVTLEVVEKALTQEPEAPEAVAEAVEEEQEEHEEKHHKKHDKKHKKKHKKKHEEEEAEVSMHVEEASHDPIVQMGDLQEIIKSLPKGKGAKKRTGAYVMGPEQAHEVLVGAILDYYQKHKHKADMYEYIRLAHKTDARMLKIHKTEDRLQQGVASLQDELSSAEFAESVPIDVNELIHVVRSEIGDFIGNVNGDRAHAVEEVVRLRAEVTALQRKLQSGGSNPANVALPETLRAGANQPNARRPRSADAPPINGPSGRLRGIEEEPAGMASDVPARARQNETSKRRAPNMPAYPEPRAQAPPEFALDGAPSDSGSARDVLRGNDRYPSLTQQGMVPATWSGPPGEHPDFDWPEDLSQPSTEHSGPRSDQGRGPDDRGRLGGWSDASGSVRSGSVRSGSDHGSQAGSEYAYSDGEYVYDDDQSLEDYMPPDDGGPYRGGGQQFRGPPGPGGPVIPSTRVVEGVGLMTGGRELGPANRSSDPEPPMDYEFTSFQDAQSQLRMMKSRMEDRQ